MNGRRGDTMTRLVVESEKPQDVAPLINDAMENERKLIRIAITRTEEILKELEKQYGMKSGTFFKRYEQGKMGDDPKFISWAGEYKMLLKLRKDYRELQGVKVCNRRILLNHREKHCRKRNYLFSPRDPRCSDTPSRLCDRVSPFYGRLSTGLHRIYRCQV